MVLNVTNNQNNPCRRYDKFPIIRDDALLDRCDIDINENLKTMPA